MKKYEKNYEDIPFDETLEMNTCSTYDCTGLIPSAVRDDAEMESYEDLYPYLPDDEIEQAYEDAFDNYNSYF